jgi:hypothetical protein
VFRKELGSSWLKLAHLKNFFDLNDNTTLELGLTGISGTNQHNSTTTTGAADLTLKWKPVQFNTYKSFTWQTEAWVSSSDTLADKNVSTFGMYSFISFQLAKRWMLTGMYSYSNLPFYEQAKVSSVSATIGWYATEFQKIEIEGGEFLSNIGKDRFQISLRWIFVIGTHGAHQY